MRRSRRSRPWPTAICSTARRRVAPAHHQGDFSHALAGEPASVVLVLLGVGVLIGFWILWLMMGECV